MNGSTTNQYIFLSVFIFSPNKGSVFQRLRRHACTEAATNTRGITRDIVFSVSWIVSRVMSGVRPGGVSTEFLFDAHISIFICGHFAILSKFGSVDNSLTDEWLDQELIHFLRRINFQSA